MYWVATIVQYIKITAWCIHYKEPEIVVSDRHIWAWLNKILDSLIDIFNSQRQLFQTLDPAKFQGPVVPSSLLLQGVILEESVSRCLNLE